MDIGTTLLEFGADTNAVTRQGISPIHLAAQGGSVDLVSLLLAKNAHVSVCNKVGALAEGLRGVPDHMTPFPGSHDSQHNSGCCSGRADSHHST